MATITQTNPDYHISRNALMLSENALGNPQYISAAVITGTRVKVAPIKIGDVVVLDYGADASYGLWLLKAYNTKLASEFASSELNIYIRVNRAEISDALVIYTDTEYDEAGRTPEMTPEQRVAELESGRYAYLLIGHLSAPMSGAEIDPVHGARQMTYDIGLFDTDQGNDEKSQSDLDKMFRLIQQSGEVLIEPQKSFTAIETIALNIRTSLTLAGHAITAFTDSISSVAPALRSSVLPTVSGVITYVTSELELFLESLRSKFLSKDEDDAAAGHITFNKGLTANRPNPSSPSISAHGISSDGDVSVTGNETVSGNVSADGNVSAGGNVSAQGSVSSGTTLSAEDDSSLKGDVEFNENTDNNGVVKSHGADLNFDEVDPSGHGWGITKAGKGVLDSLVVRRALLAAELRFNRITVQQGITWLAPGAGKIKEVTPSGYAGYITLDLEEGEYGSFAENDWVMGIYHFEGKGAASSTDNATDGMQVAGFVTIYMKITAVVSSQGYTHNERLSYVLYDQTGRILDYASNPQHPTPLMSIVAFGNATDTDRQRSLYMTTKYTKYLYNVNSIPSLWNQNCIGMMWGDLSGLGSSQEYAGYSMYLNNIYMRGVIRQIDPNRPGEDKHVINFVGDWTAGTYYKDDGVYHNEAMWYALRQTTDEPSESSSDWRKYSGVGKDGTSYRPKGSGRQISSTSVSGTAGEIGYYDGTIYERKSTGWSALAGMAEGDAYFIKMLDLALGTHVIYWNGTSWTDLGNIQGPAGEPGKTGKSLVNATTYYYVNEDPNSPPSDSEQGSPSRPTWQDGQYIWTRYVFQWREVDGTTSYTHTAWTCTTGANGISGITPIIPDLTPEIQAVSVDKGGKLSASIDLPISVRLLEGNSNHEVTAIKVNSVNLQKSASGFVSINLTGLSAKARLDSSGKFIGFTIRVAANTTLSQTYNIPVNLNGSSVASGGFDVGLTLSFPRDAAPGADAKDAEYIYIRTKDEVAPVLPTSQECADYTLGGVEHKFTDDDFVPRTIGRGSDVSQWTDIAQGVNSTWKYEWECVRKSVLDSDGKRQWSLATTPFQGVSGKATLVSRYSSDGKYIHIVGHVSTLPSSAADGEAYVLDTDGHLWVWYDSTGHFTDAGQFTGSTGVGTYAFTRYADKCASTDAGAFHPSSLPAGVYIKLTGNSGRDVGEYYSIAISSQSTGSDIVWSSQVWGRYAPTDLYQLYAEGSAFAVNVGNDRRIAVQQSFSTKLHLELNGESVLGSLSPSVTFSGSGSTWLEFISWTASTGELTIRTKSTTSQTPQYVRATVTFNHPTYGTRTLYLFVSFVAAGENATQYSFTVSSETIKINSAGSLVTNSLVIQVLKHNGSSTSVVSDLSSEGLTLYYKRSADTSDQPLSTLTPSISLTSGGTINLNGSTYVDILIKKNNITRYSNRLYVTYDGLSVVAFRNQFTLYVNPTGFPDPYTGTWTYDRPTVTGGKYIWTRQEIELSNHTFIYTQAVLFANRFGLTGSLLVNAGIYNSQTQYVSNIDYQHYVMDANGNRYLCLVTNTGQPLTDTTYWQPFNEMQPIATSAILADKGWIDVLGAGSMFIGAQLTAVVYNSDGTRSISTDAYGWVISNGEIRHTKSGFRLTSNGSISSPEGLNLFIDDSLSGNPNLYPANYLSQLNLGLGNASARSFLNNPITSATAAMGWTNATYDASGSGGALTNVAARWYPNAASNVPAGAKGGRCLQLTGTNANANNRYSYANFDPEGIFSRDGLYFGTREVKAYYVGAIIQYNNKYWYCKANAASTRIPGSAPDYWEEIQRTYIYLKPNTKYTFSVRIYIPTNGNPSNQVLNIALVPFNNSTLSYDTDSSHWKFIGQTGMTGGQWLTKSVTFTTDNRGYDNYAIRFGWGVGNSESSVTATMWVNGFKIEEGDTATELSGPATSFGDVLLQTGINIRDREIVVTSDKFEVRNNQGVPTLNVDKKGNAIFGGAVNSPMKILTMDDVGDVLIKGVASNTDTVQTLDEECFSIDLLRTSSAIKIDDSLRNTVSCIAFPFFFIYDSSNAFFIKTKTIGTKLDDTAHFITVDEARAMVGKKIYIYNTTLSGPSGGLNICLGYRVQRSSTGIASIVKRNNNTMVPNNFALTQDTMAAFECKLGISHDASTGYTECIYWERAVEDDNVMAYIPLKDSDFDD